MGGSQYDALTGGSSGGATMGGYSGGSGLWNGSGSSSIWGSGETVFQTFTSGINKQYHVTLADTYFGQSASGVLEERM